MLLAIGLALLLGLPTAALALDLSKLPGVPPDAMFSVQCGFSNRAADDPIVKPGQPGASHLHDFYGARNTNARSTTRTLAAAPSTCHRPGDRSAYWTPTMFKYGRRVESATTSVYYWSRDRIPASIGPMPTGLRMVAWGAKDGNDRSNQGVHWRCSAQGDTPSDAALGRPQAQARLAGLRRAVAADSRRLTKARRALRRARGKSARRARTRAVRRVKARLAARRADMRLAVLDLAPTDLPRCPAGSRVLMALYFPDCWNGRQLDSPDHRSHMAYGEAGSDYRSRCPASHPYPVPALVVHQVWPIGDGEGVRLSSGTTRTMHGDVFSVWDAGVQESLVRRCINSSTHCGVN